MLRYRSVILDMSSTDLKLQIEAQECGFAVADQQRFVDSGRIFLGPNTMQPRAPQPPQQAST